MACIGEPISWPRLEAHALAPDAAVTAHVAECAACRACLDDIARDVVALPGLPENYRQDAKAPSSRRRWWFGIVPALAAAALLLFLLRPRDEVREGIAHVKGVGDVVIDVVRERSGIVSYDARTFAPGDRWKVVVTCPTSAHVALTVDVRDDHTVDHPLPAADVACGNRVVLPGAFTLDGRDPNQVCVHVADQSACVTLRPE